jgi:hypothetical protein
MYTRSNLFSTTTHLPKRGASFAHVIFDSGLDREIFFAVAFPSGASTGYFVNQSVMTKNQQCPAEERGKGSIRSSEIICQASWMSLNLPIRYVLFVLAGSLALQVSQLETYFFRSWNMRGQ